MPPNPQLGNFKYMKQELHSAQIFVVVIVTVTVAVVVLITVTVLSSSSSLR
jgi:hypothetical protein